MARKKRKKSSRAGQDATATPDAGAAVDRPAGPETPDSPPKDEASEPRRFRSYFELLEEKYADEEPPQVVAPESERKADPEAAVDRRHTPRPTRKPKPVGRERPARRSAEKPPKQRSPKPPDPEATDGTEEVRSVTGVIRVDPEPPTPRIRQTQAIALDRNMRWVVVLAFLAGVVLTALVVFFLAGDDDDDFDVVAEQAAVERPAGASTSLAEDEVESSSAAPFGSVTEIASESPLPEPDAPVVSAPSPASTPPADDRSSDTPTSSDPPPADPLQASEIEALDPAAAATADAVAIEAAPPEQPTNSEPAPTATAPSLDEVSDVAATDEEAVVEDEPPVVVPAYTPARKAFTPQPSYPAEAREQGEEGTVVLSGRVTADGDVVDARVVESAGARLDRVALETFRTWQFQPAERDGVAVESPYRVSFRFALDRRPTPPAAAPSEPGTPPPSVPPPPPAEPAAGTVDDPLPFGGDFEPPQRRVSHLPSLPRGRAGEVGNLVLSVVVDRAGGVARIEIEQGVDPQVTEQAIEAVRRWRFQPATRDGEPVAVWHRLVLRL